MHRSDDGGARCVEHGLGRVVRILDVHAPELGWPALFRTAAEELERLEAEGLMLDESSAFGGPPGERALTLRFEDFRTHERVEGVELPVEDRAFLESRGFTEKDTAAVAAVAGVDALEEDGGALPDPPHVKDDSPAHAVSRHTVSRHDGAWLVDRIDFAKGKRCYFCARPLPSRAAHWVVNDKGEEATAGPRCVKKHAAYPNHAVPVFTKASFEVPRDEDDGGEDDAVRNVVVRTSVEASDLGASRGQVSDRIGDKIEYLRLRVEKLSGFSARPTRKLLEIHERHRAGPLSENDSGYLTNLAAKLTRERAALAPENLQTCYAYAFWMEDFLREEPGAEHVGKILTALKRNLTLTPNQIESVNKWFANRSGMPRLDPGAFSTYRTPPEEPAEI